MKTPLWAGKEIIPSRTGTKEKYHCIACPGVECFLLIGLKEDEPKKCIKENGGDEHGRKA
mgnify:CR=1 FL=1